tara:strand:- start:921 stop:1448 length:528 start_codon:yes stop_codon:yes gene_type:complete
MRFQEFQITEDDLRRKIKEQYPHLTEEQIDEALPAIVGAVGGAVARGAMAAGRVGAKMGTQAAKAVGQGMAKGAKAVGKMAGNMAKKGAGAVKNKVLNKIQQKAAGQAMNKLLKPGTTIPMPTKDGEEEFEIQKAQGKEITLKPKQSPKPGDPIATVHNKKDLEPILKQIATGQV